VKSGPERILKLPQLTAEKIQISEPIEIRAGKDTLAPSINCGENPNFEPIDIRARTDSSAPANNGCKNPNFRSY
jgi:hypothetical protein